MYILPCESRSFTILYDLVCAFRTFLQQLEVLICTYCSSVLGPYYTLERKIAVKLPNTIEGLVGVLCALFLLQICQTYGTANTTL